MTGTLSAAADARGVIEGTAGFVAAVVQQLASVFAGVSCGTAGSCGISARDTVPPMLCLCASERGVLCGWRAQQVERPLVELMCSQDVPT